MGETNIAQFPPSPPDLGLGGGVSGTLTFAWLCFISFVYQPHLNASEWGAIAHLFFFGMKMVPRSRVDKGLLVYLAP